MRKKLRSILDNQSTKKGKRFDLFIQAMILISLLAYAIETLPDLSPLTIKWLHFIEIVCLIIFTIEYILRIFVAKKPWKYIFSFYGIIDLLAILPFYFQGSLDLRSVRAFRIFRVFRAFKLIRYNKALNRIHLAASLVKEEIVLFFIVSSIFMYISSAGIYFFEHEAQPEVFTSIFHSAWWSVVTLTTVGYGDAYPITIGGKIFTFFILLIGVGIVTIPAGLVASALHKAREIEDDKKN